MANEHILATVVTGTENWPPLGDGSARYLQVGTVLQFMFPDGERETHGCGALLGWKESQYLISELPFSQAGPLACVAGNPCVVRYMHGGRLVGYRTVVRSRQTAPEPMLLLEYPRAIEEILLRRHPRVPINQPVALFPVVTQRGVQHVLRDAPLNGLLRDISTSGCRVELQGLEAELSKDGLVRLEFELPGLGRVTNLTGIVKNTTRQPNRCTTGIEFRFQQMEYIEFRGWGGTVQRAIEHYVSQRHGPCETAGPNRQGN